MGQMQVSRSAGTERVLTQRGRCKLEALGWMLSDYPDPATPTRLQALNGQETVPSIKLEKSDTGSKEQHSELETQTSETTENNQRLQQAMTHLQQSGWYWGSITAAEAKEVLNAALDGTFLLRDSSHPGYLFTLSVRTALGPTHLRIQYSSGHFGLDSVLEARPLLRQFEGAVDLVQFYAQTEPSPQADAQTDPDSTLQLKLTRPLLRSTPSLQHLCRLVINQHSHSHTDLPLPDSLKDFLLEYPFIL